MTPRCCCQAYAAGAGAQGGEVTQDARVLRSLTKSAAPGWPACAKRSKKGAAALWTPGSGAGSLPGSWCLRESDGSNVVILVKSGGEKAIPAWQDCFRKLSPELDVRWSLGCPMCGTDQYTFETAALRDYVMCTASADYWWVFCHLYRRDSGPCGNCEIRKGYWGAQRSLE